MSLTRHNHHWQGVIYSFSFAQQLFSQQRLRKSWSGNWLAVFFFGRKMIWTTHWFEHQDNKGMPSCGMKFCLFGQQTDTRMHTVVDAFNCRFVYLGRLSIMFVKFWHWCEMLYVWPRQPPWILFSSKNSGNLLLGIYQLAATRFSASSEEANVVTLRSIVLLVIFWSRFSSAAAHEERPLVHIRLVVLHKSVFISLKFPDFL